MPRRAGGERQAGRDSKATEGDAGGTSDLVVVGASAGGIEALSILVDGLPADFPAPVLVAQHLDPRRESHLTEILGRRSRLPVVTVTDRERLEPGRIYVVPGNRHVAVTDHEVWLESASERPGPVPSVDHVLTTAAAVFGEGLIAVILTGTGTDGAIGARRVKAAGGTVVAQDPDTARFPSMPAALAPNIVDIVAPLDAIGRILNDLVTGAYMVEPSDDKRLLDAFLATVRDRTGIDFASYKRSTILRRLERRMVATGNRGLREYVRFLETHPDEYGRLTSSMLIKVTEFMRDPELFDHLRRVTLPPLIDAARRRGRELRLWSAGTATGEEAYTLAIVIADLLGDELGDWTVRIFATDIDGDAVAFARRGVYPSATLAPLSRELVDRHFSRLDSGDYEVRPHIRALVIFGQHDLAIRAPFPRIDLALCRNVLIYFTPELQKRALQLFAFALRDGGGLVLGKAETTTPLADYFVTEDARLKIYRRRGARLLIPPMRIPDTTVTGSLRAVLPRQADDAVSAPESSRARAALERAETIVSELPVGVVIVDAEYDVTLINPLARRLLGIHGAAVGRDLIHLSGDTAAPQLRAALDEALAGRRSTVTIKAAGPQLAGESGTWLRIDVLPQPDGGRSRGAALVVRDVTEERAEAARTTAERSELGATVARLEQQVATLVEANTRLLADNAELAQVNVELRNSNEELLVANEEVQAATEEVETLNEELQSTNEELETLNEELQATIEELNTTNDDMVARSLELQQLATSLEEQQARTEVERARLAAAIGTQPDAILVVDAAGREVIRNEAWGHLDAVTLEAGDDPSLSVSLDALRDRVAAGERFELQLRATGSDGRRRWFEAYGRPLPIDGDNPAGGILVIHDTTDLSLRRLQEEFVAIVAHELRTPLTALRGYLQMLGRPGTDPETSRVLAVEQADRLARLVDELFDVARAETGALTIERRPVALRELVAQTVEIGRSLSDRHRISLEMDDADLVVNGDPARLQQVILNLIANAIVHAPAAPDIAVRLRGLRRRAEIEVEDHGPGIPHERRGTIFTRFQRGDGSPGGLGLGLYISREIVTAHGGTIEVDSEQGEGTTFTVRLPLAAGVVRRAATASTGPSLDGDTVKESVADS